MMTSGYHTNEGWVEAPLDDRDEENPDWVVDPDLSSTNTDFGKLKEEFHL